MPDFLRKIAESYLRWRHSKGYGVHSPFAYSIVEMVINPGRGYGFYGYKDIERTARRLFPRDSLIEHRGKLLLRLMALLRIKHLVISGEMSREMKSFLQVVAGGVSARLLVSGPNSVYGPESLLLIWGENSQEKVKLAENVLKAYSPVVAFEPSPELRGLLETCLREGVAFYDKDAIIAVPRKETAFAGYLCSL